MIFYHYESEVVAHYIEQQGYQVARSGDAYVMNAGGENFSAAS
jgi:hypothetical protein